MKDHQRVVAGAGERDGRDTRVALASALPRLDRALFAALGRPTVVRMQPTPAARSSALSLWGLLGGDPAHTESLELSGTEALLPSRFAVTPFATAAVGVASLGLSGYALWRLLQR